MTTLDRIKFSWCSMLCNKEAKASKNYLYALTFKVTSETEISILVLHTDLTTNEEEEKFKNSSWYPDLDPYDFKLRITESGADEYIDLLYLRDMFRTFQYCGYFLRFQRIDNHQFMFCINPDGKEFWRVELDQSKSLVQHAAQQFATLLKIHQHSVKKIKLFSSDPIDINLDVRVWENLEDLALIVETNYEQFVSKLRKPLKMLRIKSNEPLSDAIPVLPQIYEVQNLFSCFNAALNSEQFSRLSAFYIAVNAKLLTEVDVFNLIKSWQNGTRQLGACLLHNVQLNFAYSKLLKMLSVNPPDQSWKKVRIDSQMDVSKFASIRYTYPRLVFQEEYDVKVFRY